MASNSRRRLQGMDATLQKLRPTAQARFTPLRVGQNQNAGNNSKQLSDALGKWADVSGRAYLQNKKQEASQRRNEVAAQKELSRAYAGMFEEQSGEKMTPEAVQEMFPELHPEVAQHISKNGGSTAGRDFANARVQEIMEDDSVRLNTQARLEAYGTIREEAMEEFQGDPYFLAGALESLDKTLDRNETTFIKETADHQREVVRNEFSNRVMEALAQGKPVDEVDAEYDQNSPIGRRERKQLVFQAYQEAALADQDPSVLDRIPDKYLDAETKAQIPQLRRDIRDGVFQEITQQNRVETIRRQEETREGKVGILDTLSEGGTINPMDYRDNPALYDYAKNIANQPQVDPTESTFNRENFKTRIMRAGFSGDYREAFQGDPEFLKDFPDGRATLDGLREHVLGRADLAPAHKRKLMEDLPNLMEGQSVMRHDAVRQQVTDVLDGVFRDLGNSTNARIKQLVEGENLRADAMRSYSSDIRSRVMAHYEDNGEWPRGTAIREIAEGATQRAVDMVERRIRITTEGEPQQSPQGNPRGGATAGSSNAEPAPQQEQTEEAPAEFVEYLKANNTPETRDSFKRRFGYLPEGVE